MSVSIHRAATELWRMVLSALALLRHIFLVSSSFDRVAYKRSYKGNLLLCV